MKFLIAIFLVLFCAESHGAQPVTPTSPHSAQKECRIGSWSYYIKQDQVCINTAAKCRTQHGVWGGTEMGRGRSPGCTLPTKDAGKACTDASQCEGSCLANYPPQAAKQLGQPVRCGCSAKTGLTKGVLLGICTKQGIHWVHID